MSIIDEAGGGVRAAVGGSAAAAPVILGCVP